MTEHKQGDGQPWQPEADFYLGNPRSAKLRQVSLSVTDRVEALLHDPGVARDEDKQRQLYAELEQLNGRLISLGVKQNMNCGESEKRYKTDPVFTSEWVAGQVMTMFEYNVPTETDVVPIIKEHSEAEIEERGYLLSNPSGMPQIIEDFITLRDMVNVTYRFLDGKPQSPFPDEAQG